jgi:two-component system, NarL family, invasion response regulator UvrY
VIEVLIADDHTIVRRGLIQIVMETDDIVVTGEASNGQEVLELLRERSWDVVLLDLAMPGRGGMDTLRRLNNDYPDLPVLILSIYPEDQYAVRALKEGAAGYLTKERAPEELVFAIRKAARGGKYVSASLAEKLASDLSRDGSKAPHETLSEREYQVMLMLASGKAVSEIGKELNLSVKTISTHRARLLKKMAMRSNAELTQYAFHNKLID